MRRTIGLRLAGWRFRDTPDRERSFARIFSESHRALVILPLSNVPGQVSPEQILSSLKQKFTDENLTVVAGTQETYLSLLLPRSTIVRVAPTDLTRFFLPRPEITKQVERKTYDLAIDLNLDFVLPSGYICRASKAKVRVGFSSPRADLFYNFQVQRNKALSPASLYDRLAACLQMF